jgi:NAD(P)-dependent dehydrogenase (short-subunit alcohol dehydrogenase family)
LSAALATEVTPSGITVPIVEPGAFRAGLHRIRTRQEAAAIPRHPRRNWPPESKVTRSTDFDQ